ncbi:MAG: MFS transporter, partial [Beijerinckiaceae bacterium]|nr:MFS transporter [Beijerinckiaceae bacterium]
MTAASEIAPRGEIKTIGLVSFAHLLSHFYMLSLPPLFLYLRGDLGVSYIELGLTVTAYAITTGLLQTPMGFLVHRIGGGKVLVGGLFVNAAAIAAVAFCTQYWQVIALMFIAGAGSSVFHPADYSILATRVGSKRLGRALATHALGGNLGFVAAPPVVVGLATLWDWRT